MRTLREDRQKQRLETRDMQYTSQNIRGVHSTQTLECTYGESLVNRSKTIVIEIVLFSDYVSELFTELLKWVEGKNIPSDPKIPGAPAPLCSSFDHPIKDEAVTKYQSRFSLT